MIQKFSLFFFFTFALQTKNAFVHGSVNDKVDNSNSCQNLIYCYEKVLQKNSECTNMTKQRPPASVSNSSIDQCDQRMKEKTMNMHGKEMERMQNRQECLKTRLDNAKPFDSKKVQICQNAFSKLDQVSKRNRSKQDAGKKADTDNKAEETTLFAQMKNDRKAEQQGAAQIKADRKAENKAAAQAKAQQKTDEKTAAAQKNAERKEFDRKVTQCNGEVQRQRQICSEVARCCSEKLLCDAQVDASATGTELKTAQYENMLQSRECRELKAKKKN